MLVSHVIALRESRHGLPNFGWLEEWGAECLTEQAGLVVGSKGKLRGHLGFLMCLGHGVGLVSYVRCIVNLGLEIEVRGRSRTICLLV